MRHVWNIIPKPPAPDQPIPEDPMPPDPWIRR